MKYNEFGQTGLNVSRIGLGTLQLQFLDLETSADIVKTAHDQGINFIETGRVYKDSEEKIGAAMQRHSLDFIIASKTMKRTKTQALQDVEISLKNLKIPKIHLYQLHMVSDRKTLKQVTANEGALEGLLMAKEDGKIDHIGISGHDIDVLMEATEIYPFESVQFAFNVIEKENVRIIPFLDKKKIGKLSMKPLGGGNIKFTKLAIKYALSEKIESVFVGVNTPSQLKENIKAIEDPIALSAIEKAQLDEAADSLGKTFCRNCGYCQCPNEINIRLIMMFGRMWNGYDGMMKKNAVFGYSALPVKADVCDKCGTCETLCPYHLQIQEKLEDIHACMNS
jgi:predicted aldo/keto reductase-like oxidoreductase